jgi:hypothetical protein
MTTVEPFCACVKVKNRQIDFWCTLFAAVSIAQLISLSATPRPCHGLRTYICCNSIAPGCGAGAGALSGAELGVADWLIVNHSHLPANGKIGEIRSIEPSGS